MGKRHNLTRHILSQIELFDQGDSASLPPNATALKRSGSSRGAGDADVAAALRASVKLSDGDLRGAVQALVSESSFAPST